MEKVRQTILYANYLFFFAIEPSYTGEIYDFRDGGVRDFKNFEEF